MLFKIFIINSFLIFHFLIINAHNLCTYYAYLKYTDLAIKYPELSNEFKILTKIPTSIWYTDNDQYTIENVKNSLNNCGDLLSTIAIYGIPDKDCNDKQSARGSNKNTDDYKKFLNALVEQVQDKHIIYMIEPDALNFLVPGGCGINNNYKNNLIMAIEILSKNKNAQLYLDIGYWNVIYSDEKIIEILNIIYELDPNSRVIGFTLNISNYRKTDEMVNACIRINKLSKRQYTCIIGTSRNYNGPSIDNQWCNLISAGIGQLPTAHTNNTLIDYYLWIKPPVELDGNCIGFSNSYQTNLQAGDISIEYFKLLWNNGIIKKEYNNCNK